MKKIRTCCLILAFAAIMLMPPILQRWASRFALSGVSETAEFPVPTVKGILDGSLQESVNSYYAEHLPGRDLMIKLRNQAIFSLFAKSPNENIIIGKDNVLFEKEYVLKYKKVYPPASREFVEDLCTKLTAIQKQLAERGKEMYVFITPTKVRYYEEYVPDRYTLAQYFVDDPGNYEIFTEVLKDYPLTVYDSIAYIDQQLQNQAFPSAYPLYYKTGSHWSWMLSLDVTTDFIRFLNENSRFTFPESEVECHPVDAPLHPDADIFNSLNLLIPPYDTYYQADLLSQPRTDEGPNLFCRGGSFMGQTITPMINNGYFHQDTYIENTIIAHDRYSQMENFSDYSELDLKHEFDQADIVIFEVNEAHVPVMSFSLIDYLIEHPEILSE